MHPICLDMATATHRMPLSCHSLLSAQGSYGAALPPLPIPYPSLQPPHPELQALGSGPMHPVCLGMAAATHRMPLACHSLLSAQGCYGAALPPLPILYPSLQPPYPELQALGLGAMHPICLGMATATHRIPLAFHSLLSARAPMERMPIYMVYRVETWLKAGQERN